MFLGQYDFNGEPEQLLAAYDRFMSLVPSTSVFFHVCLRREAGISIIDACPTTEDFAETIADPGLRAMMADAGLPAPHITPLGESHAAHAAADYLT